MGSRIPPRHTPACAGDHHRDPKTDSQAQDRGRGIRRSSQGFVRLCPGCQCSGARGVLPRISRTEAKWQPCRHLERKQLCAHMSQSHDGARSPSMPQAFQSASSPRALACLPGREHPEVRPSLRLMPIMHLITDAGASGS